MLKIILLGLGIYFFYRFFSKSKKKAAKKKRGPLFYPRPAEPPQNRMIEEMKRCPTCGTFNPKSCAQIYEGEYFCNIECREQRN